MFVISYHKHIPDDIRKFPKPTQSTIRRAIEQKLSEAPEYYGKPLRGSLLGFRSLRVGEYRVIYHLEENEVFVVMIAHRSRVYEELTRRV